MEINKHNFRHILKYKKIQNLFIELYEKKRMRKDDVFILIEKKFTLSHARINKILNYDLPTNEFIEKSIKELKPNININFMFD